MRNLLTNYRRAFAQCDTKRAARDGAAAILGGLFCIAWAVLSPLIALYGALRPTRFFLLLRRITE